MSEPVTILASFRPHPGDVSEVREILGTMVAETRKEPGNVVYDLYSSQVEGDTSFHLIERYENEGAVEAHRDTEHYRAYRAAIPEHLAGDIDGLILSDVDVDGAAR